MPEEGVWPVEQRRDGVRHRTHQVGHAGGLRVLESALPAGVLDGEKFDLGGVSAAQVR